MKPITDIESKPLYKPFVSKRKGKKYSVYVKIDGKQDSFISVIGTCNISKINSGITNHLTTMTQNAEAVIEREHQESGTKREN